MLDKHSESGPVMGTDSSKYEVECKTEGSQHYVTFSAQLSLCQCVECGGMAQRILKHS